jgi:hypothetical protein
MSKTKEVVKTRALTVRKVGVDLPSLISAVKELMPIIVPKEDFALIFDNNRVIIEPKREICLKLCKFMKFSFDTEMLEKEKRKVPNKFGGGNFEQTWYTVKAKVWDKDGNSWTGLGIASTVESHTKNREDHDALARAETRALKRAIEAGSGLPLLNQIILKIFGGSEVSPEQAKKLGFIKHTLSDIYK